jgi:hypothetical protein
VGVPEGPIAQVHPCQLCWRGLCWTEGANMPAGLARENLRSTTTQRERGNDDGTRRREEEGQRLQKASDSAFRRAQQARVSRRASVQAAGRTIGLEHAFGWMLNFGAFSASMNRATGGLRCVF